MHVETVSQHTFIKHNLMLENPQYFKSKPKRLLQKKTLQIKKKANQKLMKLLLKILCINSTYLF